MIAYRSALPMVWPSPSNWNEAAVSVAPGSWVVWLVFVMEGLEIGVFGGLDGSKFGYAPRRSVALRGWGHWTGASRWVARHRPWTGPYLESARIQALWYTRKKV